MKVNFLLAEEVRLELNNKITIIGLYAGDVIIMLKRARPEEVPENTPTGLERLAILAIISDAPEGELKFKGRVIAPSGKLDQPEFSLGEAVTKEGYSNTVIAELKPFIVEQPGIFHFELFVGRKKFTFPFEIREQVNL